MGNQRDSQSFSMSRSNSFMPMPNQNMPAQAKLLGSSGMNRVATTVNLEQQSSKGVPPIEVNLGIIKEQQQQEDQKDEEEGNNEDDNNNQKRL